MYTLHSEIENLHIAAEEPIISPAALKEELPLSKDTLSFLQQSQATIKNILNRKDPRLFIVVGPCSIHDVKAAREYASKLKALAKELQEHFFIAMRVYFEKPRTHVGWQGFLNDPDLDGSYQIEKGLHLGRGLLLDLANDGIPVAGEALDLISPQYIQDLISWTAIGARTTESQNHRKMASGLSSVVGFKNATSGDMQVAVNAIRSAAISQHFLSVHPQGQVAVVRTNGNPNTHVVLRGGNQRPNYDSVSIQQCEELLEEANLPQSIMVDCSHANTNKQYLRQIDVLKNLTQQIIQGNQSIFGMMIESHLHGGNQPISDDLSMLKYGVSITDPCLDWESTRSALYECYEQLAPILPNRYDS